MLTQKGLFLVGREVEAKGPNKGQTKEVLSRRIAWQELNQVSLSTRQDDFVVIHVSNSHDSLLQIQFKTEFVTVAKRLMMSQCNRELKTVFSDR